MAEDLAKQHKALFRDTSFKAREAQMRVNAAMVDHAQGLRDCEAPCFCHPDIRIRDGPVAFYGQACGGPNWEPWIDPRGIEFPMRKYGTRAGYLCPKNNWYTDWCGICNCSVDQNGAVDHGARQEAHG